MRRMLFLVATVAVALAACSSSATPSANPNAQPTASTTEAAAPLFTCADRALAWDGTSAVDLTGTWAGDDQGVYYLRQLGDEVWWLGMSGIGGTLVARGTEWTNVYHGKLSGDAVTGTYADVPGGKIQDKGPVDLKLDADIGWRDLARANPTPLPRDWFRRQAAHPVHPRVMRLGAYPRDA